MNRRKALAAFAGAAAVPTVQAGEPGPPPLPMPDVVLSMVSCGAYLIVSCVNGYVYRLAPGPGYWHSVVRLADVPYGLWTLRLHGPDVYGYSTASNVMRIFEGDR